jgi:hypothetical protein
MTMRNGNDSSADLEYEAEATRNNLASTLDELRGRMTPGQVMDEVLSYAKGSGASFLQSLFEAAKANPIPTMLIGAGCAMFLSSQKSAHTGQDVEYGTGRRDFGSDTGRVSEAGKAAYERTSDTAAADRRGMSKAADAAADRAKRAAEGIKEGLTSAADAVSSTARNATEGLRESAADLRGGMGDAMSDMSRRASETYGTYARDFHERSEEAADYAREQAEWARRQARRGWSALREQPLVLAAIGVAIGAAIGAALPSTRTENELLGEASDRVKETAAEVAGEQYEKAKTAAVAAVSQVGEAAEAAGLTKENLREAAGDVAERFKSVAGAATQAARATSNEKQSPIQDFAEPANTGRKNS